MEFRVLGPVGIAVEGKQVTLGSRTQRAILAVLLAGRGRAVSADDLIEAVWGVKPPPSARKSLHSQISRLRRTLAQIAPDAAEAIGTVTAGYRLHTDAHDLDADRFEDLVGGPVQRRDEDASHAVRRLDEALALWRGTAFGEFGDNDVLRAQAVRLNELRVGAATDRVDARLAMGDHQGAIPEARALIADDPLAERPHGQLMTALYRDGRQADALAVYRRLQKRLRDELGVDPSPALVSLHSQILHHDAALAAPRRLPFGEGRSEPRRAGDAPGTPPAAPVGLVGRHEDVAAVTAMITRLPLVTLTGPGGVGKTSLGREVADFAAPEFEDGVVDVELASVRDASDVAAALVGALGVEDKGERPSVEAVVAGLGNRRLLLVLDSCEHVLEPVGHVVERIGRDCPRVAVLATSREYLHLAGERVWQVAPLAVPRPGASAAEVRESPSGELLRARAQAAEPSFELTEANAGTIAELCRRLDGIPLAIELAAARIRALEPGDLLARIEHRFDVLTGGPRRESGRHRTLQAVVEWSYKLLTDAEAHLFDRLSVFAGPFSLGAAEQIGAAGSLTESQVAGVLAELVDKSMVAVDREHEQLPFRLLDTLRAYGTQRLEASGAADAARRAHAAYHVGLAEQLGAQIRGPREGAARAQIDAVFDDLRVAHSWLIDAGEAEQALRLSAALHDDLVFRPRSEVFAWAQGALELPGAPEHPSWAAAMVTDARGRLYRGELEHALHLAESALATGSPDGLPVLWGLYVQTTVALYEGRLDDVLALAEQRVRIADSLGQHYHRALAGVSQVLAHMYRGDAEAAEAVAATARASAETSGNDTAQAWALYASGEALLDTDPSRAGELLEQAVEAARRVDRPLIEGVTLVSLASVHGRTGDTDRALELFAAAIAHWRRLGDYTHQLTTLRNLVELLARLGECEPAALLYGAVTAGSTPSFGAEAARLSTAWTHVEEHVGADRARTLAKRGRGLPQAEMLDAALAALQPLLERGGAARPL